MGPQGLEKISTLAQLPPEFRVRPPVSILEGQVGWEKSGKTSLRAKVAVKEGPRVSIDMLSSAEAINVRQLLIEDETSKASASFSLGRKEFRLDFKGQLKKTTLDRLLLKNELLIGSISGDFGANILIDQPLGSTAHGRIQGTGLHYHLPVPVKLPIVLESVALDVKGRKVNVDAGLSAPEDRHMRLAGDVDLSGKEILVDMNLTTDGIHWKKVETAVKEEEKTSPPGKGEKRKLPPVSGILRVRSDYLAYGKYSVKPFHADVSFSGDDVSVAVREANLCGISTPGTVKITPQEVGLKFNPASRAMELAPTLHCMFGEKRQATGIFDLKGEITARGKPEELVQSLKGNFEFNGKKGHIFQDPVLLKIFALLNVGEIFIGQPTDLGKEGFGYKSINIKGNLQNGKLLLEEAVLDGPSMGVIAKGEIDLINETIDLSVFVAPLKTLDRIVKYIPILGHVLGGSLIAIPLRVKGNLNDPEVTPLDPAMIGEDLFGIVKRTLGLPFNIIQPLFPGKKKE